MSLDKLMKQYNITEDELKTILKSSSQKPKPIKTLQMQPQSRYKIGVISDTHIGHKMFYPELFAHAGNTFRQQGIKTVLHAGDILEGMSGRPGHIYELDYVGFTNQMDYAERLWRDHFRGLDTYGIIGNHDGWYVRRGDSGANPGIELERRLADSRSKFHYLGDSEADIHFGKSIVKLFHPNDGSAYATSYKMQKLIESLEIGTKPNMILQGHYHKSMYTNNRGVHGFDSGTLCGQTGFMRGKKLAANVGFWTIDFGVKGPVITDVKSQFFPYIKDLDYRRIKL